MKKYLISSFVTLLLAACAAPQASLWPHEAQKVSAPSLHYRPAAEAKTVAYYDAEGEPADEPTRGGFYRQLLGTNSAGQPVVQDFYQDSQTPQTNPVLLREPEALTDFSAKNVEGSVIWYTPEGRVYQTALLQNGKLVSNAYYDEEGRLKLETTANSAVLYHANGKVSMLMEEVGLNEAEAQDGTEEKRRSVLFDEVGQKIGTIEQQGNAAIVVFDAQGKRLEGEEAKNIALLFVRRIAEMANSLL